jgi:predicted CoA-substrate-specific enzyme activase
VKLVVAEADPSGKLEVVWRDLREHHKEPARVLGEMLQSVSWPSLTGAAATGRLARMLNLPRVPVKQAQVAAVRQRHPDLETATVVSIGSRGFSVLELREGGLEVFRENSRCSQGTGNFLRQLVERFDLTLEEASTLAETVEQPAPLSGRCPVILKTDMTHLANRGVERAAILAGLYDAVCENVQVLIKPKLAPPAVILVGGVTRARRVRDRFAQYLEKQGMRLLDHDAEDALFLEALGAAAVAARLPEPLCAKADLLAPRAEARLDTLPAPAGSLDRVRRLPRPAAPVEDGRVRDLILGFDIGSTGSKTLAVDRETREIVWESYLNTNGNPVAASKALMQRFAESPARQHRLLGFGVTGSGREIVGSLLGITYGQDRVYVLNEIAAHAEGALHFDPEVDTIFEIGGQDAKYIRLADGRVVDAAMNEACSAGTGSFIEEQGKRFAGIRDVVHLGQTALTADHALSLGQHCSVFMAEIIDEAVGAGAPQSAIIAGIYESIIQNYLNRVKGARTVGQRIFCQGMPFAADALAAAVARQTGSDVVIPPNPGTVGALGIALLARRSLALPEGVVQPEPYLTAQVLSKDTFVCKSTKGCGAPGNKCRIDQLVTEVTGKKSRFTWGGSCSLYDKGTHRKKLPDLTPDPFREREALVDRLLADLGPARGLPTIGITDEFALKSLFPFFATYLHRLGFDLAVRRGATQAVLKRGIEEANVPFCAPMQQYHGLVTGLAEARPEYLFLPMVRSLPRLGDEPHAVICPIVQASADVIRTDLGADLHSKVISPVIDVGADHLDGELFRRSCRATAAELGRSAAEADAAFDEALEAQLAFDGECLRIGERALAFARERELTPIIVLGRAYTIYNTVLNSNVPTIVREQGALPIPVDCYPVADAAPTFEGLYWGYAQRSLRAAHQIRRTPGQYALYCSNYSCGPDSFNLHFFAYAMEGRPFAIIETDGHSGDAGTKTRVEAFLHCVKEDQAARAERPTQSFVTIDQDRKTLHQIREDRETLLIPRMGPGADVLAALFRGVGFDAEALPMPDAEVLALGRRHTSGKECVPMTITTGSLLQRLAREPDPERRFCFFMPTANGPCRFGVYNLLHKIILERLGEKRRVTVFSPVDDDYFAEVPPAFRLITWAGFVAMDLLLEAFYWTRPVEKYVGAAERVYRQHHDRLVHLVEAEARRDLSQGRGLREIATGQLFGISRLLHQATEDFAAIADLEREVPTVSVVGEIYVRCDPFANGFIIDRLEERGVRARFAPFNEWIEYTDWVTQHKRREGLLPPARSPLLARITSTVQAQIQERLYALVARGLRWPHRTSVKDSLKAAGDYLRSDLTGEAVLTLGGPTHEHRQGEIQGVVSVGPLECMPNKLSETQLFHVAEREGLLSLTLSLNGDPLDLEVLDSFVFEVKDRFRKVQAQRALERPRTTRVAAPRPFRQLAAATTLLAGGLRRMAGNVGQGLAGLNAARKAAGARARRERPVG